MNKYESVIILSANASEEAMAAFGERMKELISANGELTSVDEWGKRKLAYLINKESEGYYILMDFESEAEFPAELDRIFKITDGVIRSMIIKKGE